MLSPVNIAVDMTICVMMMGMMMMLMGMMMMMLMLTMMMMMRFRTMSASLFVQANLVEAYSLCPNRHRRTR